MQPDTVTAGAGADIVVNNNFRALSPSGLYGIRPAGTAGLVLGYFGGAFNGVSVADGTVTLTASNTNYVVAHRTTGVVTAATSTTNWLDTTTYMQLYQLVAGSASFTIASTSDKRQAFGGSGSGGGSVAGSDKQIQYNNSGAFGAEAGFEYDQSTNTATIPNCIFTGLALTAVSATGGAGLRLPHGAAPTSPNNGDMWTTTAGLYARINGSTIGPFVTSVSGMTNPLTTTGDIVYSSSGTTPARLGIGSTNQVLTVVAGIPSWQNASSGFANPMTTTGDLIVGGASGTAGRLAAGTSGYVLTSTGAGSAPSWQAASGGALTNFTESVNSSSPNATVPVVRLLATNAATNVDIALTPKGTGSIAAQVADSTSTGGNKRGTQSIDWQMTRTTAAQIASGNASVISGGGGNTASGQYSIIPGGTACTASGTGSFAAGNTAVSSADYGVAFGATCTASGIGAFVGGDNTSSTGISSFAYGLRNTADANYSWATGARSLVRGVPGARAHASGYYQLTGDSQYRDFHLTARTTSGTGVVAVAARMLSATATGSNQVNVPADTSIAFHGVVSAKRTGSSDCKTWEVKGGIKNIGGTTALLGTPTVTDIGSDAGAAAWAVAVTADNALDTLTFTCTGAASQDIVWTFAIRASETQYA
jgi:hypothetical protein